MNKIDPTQYEDCLATKEDLREILQWLKDDYYGFLNQKDSIEKGQQEGKLLVLREKKSGKAVAFCLGGLSEGGGVFVVHPEMRANLTENMAEKKLEMTGGRGIGTRLFECCLERAKRKGKAGLSIQCNPERSADFWEKRGFQILQPKSTGVIRAVYPIPRQFKLPGKHQPIQVTIELKHECDEVWSAPFHTNAEMVEDGKYLLQNRFVEYIPNKDFLIRVLIDEKEIINNEIKNSAEYGVEYHNLHHARFVMADKICWKDKKLND